MTRLIDRVNENRMGRRGLLLLPQTDSSAATIWLSHMYYTGLYHFHGQYVSLGETVGRRSRAVRHHVHDRKPLGAILHLLSVRPSCPNEEDVCSHEVVFNLHVSRPVVDSCWCWCFVCLTQTRCHYRLCSFDVPHPVLCALSAWDSRATCASYFVCFLSISGVDLVYVELHPIRSSSNHLLFETKLLFFLWRIVEWRGKSCEFLIWVYVDCHSSCKQAESLWAWMFPCCWSIFIFKDTEDLMI